MSKVKTPRPVGNPTLASRARRHLRNTKRLRNAVKDGHTKIGIRHVCASADPQDIPTRQSRRAAARKERLKLMNITYGLEPRSVRRGLALKPFRKNRKNGPRGGSNE